jgi:hypothetical protein
MLALGWRKEAVIEVRACQTTIAILPPRGYFPQDFSPVEPQRLEAARRTAYSPSSSMTGGHVDGGTRMQDRADPHAREHAIGIARQDPPSGVSPEEAATAIEDVRAGLKNLNSAISGVSA